jgi:hypothetical protein
MAVRLLVSRAYRALAVEIIFWYSYIIYAELIIKITLWRRYQKCLFLNSAGISPVLYGIRKQVHLRNNVSLQYTKLHQWYHGIFYIFLIF